MGLIILLTQCIGNIGVEQPLTGVSGEEVTIVFKPKITPNSNAGVEANVRLEVGFLAPKGWNAGANTIMSYTRHMGKGPKIRVPAVRTPAQSNSEEHASMIEKAGIGGNLNKCMERG